MNHLLIFLSTFLSVYLLTFVIRKLANKWDFVDKPEERKFHTEPTALMGGLGVLVGIFLEWELPLLSVKTSYPI